MIYLLLVAIVVVFFISNRDLAGRIQYLEKKIAELADDLRLMRGGIAGTAPPEKPKQEAPKPETPATPQPKPQVSSVPLSAGTPQKAEEKKKSAGFNFEQQFGARLPVWIGGIALALSGFYLLKYSIDNNLLTEQVRVMLGAVLGIGLVAGGKVAHARKNLADGTRIAQALCGAGIAVLYGTIFAATSLYHLLPSLLGFAGMAVVTAYTVILSLRLGMPIALLGLLGGFVTPGLIGSESPSALTLFIYLYCVLSGLMAVIRRKNWWVLAIPAVLGAFLWVCGWIFGGHYTASDNLYLGLFVLAVSATIVHQAHQRPAEEAGKGVTSPMFLSYLTFGGAIATMALVTVKGGFGVFEWLFYGLLAAGGIVMAVFKPKEYRLVPWAAMAVNIVMLASDRADAHILTFAAFGALYTLSALYAASLSFVRGTAQELSWSRLATAAALGFFLLAYATQTGDFSYWGATAIALAALFAHSALRVFKSPSGNNHALLAGHILTATAFISIGMTIELDQSFLPIAFAGQLLATAWVYAKLGPHGGIEGLRLAGKALLVAFIFVLLPQFLLLLSITLHSLFGAEWRFWSDDHVPFAEDPFLQLALPMVLAGASSWLFRLRRDGRFVAVLETVTVLLGALAAFYLARHALHPGENVLYVKAGFFERGLMTNLFFAAGLLCIFAGKHLQRSAIIKCGTVIFLMAAFRVVFFDMIKQNPLWNGTQDVGDIFILNKLLLPFALPVGWMLLVDRPPFGLAFPVPKIVKGVFMLACVFLLVTLNVRQFFQGSILADGRAAENIEIYAYSIAWLLLGVALLVAGTVRVDKHMRVASLAIMLLTIGKVFLYDAGELSGLYRVFSFMGLGVSLIALSWFYTRFVFTRTER